MCAFVQHGRSLASFVSHAPVRTASALNESPTGRRASRPYASNGGQRLVFAPMMHLQQTSHPGSRSRFLA